MRKLMISAVLVSLLFVLGGCGGGQQYKVSTSDGMEFISVGQPQYDKGQNVYTFTDDQGKSVTVNKDKVEYIKEYDPPRQK